MSDFITKARLRHGDAYDYSKTVYVKAHAKLTITCRKHGDFEQQANSHLSGRGCPECKKDKLREAFSSSLEDFTNKARKVHGDKYDYSNVLYTNNNTEVAIGCNACGTLFMQQPTVHTDAKCGCPACGVSSGKSIRNTQAYWVGSRGPRVPLSDVIRDIVIPYGISIEESSYKGLDHKIKGHCDTHGDFSIRAARLRKTAKICPTCSRESSRAHQLSQVIEKAHFVHQGIYDYNESIPYKGNRTRLEIKCPEHGWFTQTAMNHLAGRGCHTCGAEITTSTSQAETEIFQFCQALTEAKQSVRSLVPGYEADIYLPMFKLVIEFNGLYWHSSAVKDKRYHVDKSASFRKAGYDIIHIWEDEWRDKRPIVKSILKSRMSIYANRVAARKTIIREVDAQTSRAFFDSNHIQGFLGSEKHFALLHEGTIVAMASFSRPRAILGTKDCDWELTRFCNQVGTQVLGGLGKLSHAVKGRLLTFCDHRLFNGGGYQAAGFTLERITDPGYCYVKNGLRYSRIQFQKHRQDQILPMFDPVKTGEENMAANKYHRLYDCGNLVLTKNVGI